MLLEEMVLHPYTYWQHKGDSVGLRKSSWRTREGTGEDRLIKKIHYMHIYIYQTRKHFLCAPFSPTVFPSPSKIFMTQMLDLFFKM